MVVERKSKILVVVLALTFTLCMCLKTYYYSAEHHHSTAPSSSNSHSAKYLPPYYFVPRVQREGTRSTSGSTLKQIFQKGRVLTKKNIGRGPSSSSVSGRYFAVKMPKVFTTSVRLLKESNKVKMVLDQVMKRNGTMEKSGFINMIHHQQNQNTAESGGEGEYTTSKSKCFDRFKDLLDEIQKQQKKVGKGPLREVNDVANGKKSIDELSTIYIILNLFMEPSSRQELVKWLNKKAHDGSDSRPNTLKKCKAHLIVEYTCCIKSSIPLLSPQYAEIRVRVG